MRTYVIGRSRFADIVFADPSVAPRHAELTLTDDGRGYLVDAGADMGSAARPAAGASFVPWRQGFLTPGAVLRFGRTEIAVEALIAMARGRPQGEPGRIWQGEGPGETGSGAGGGSGSPGGPGGGGHDTRPRGRVERDPMTGEIIGRPL